MKRKDCKGEEGRKDCVKGRRRGRKDCVKERKEGWVKDCKEVEGRKEG